MTTLAQVCLWIWKLDAWSQNIFQLWGGLSERMLYLNAQSWSRMFPGPRIDLEFAIIQLRSQRIDRIARSRSNLHQSQTNADHAGLCLLQWFMFWCGNPQDSFPVKDEADGNWKWFILRFFTRTALLRMRLIWWLRKGTLSTCLQPGEKRIITLRMFIWRIWYDSLKRTKFDLRVAKSKTVDIIDFLQGFFFVLPSLLELVFPTFSRFYLQSVR